MEEIDKTDFSNAISDDEDLMMREVIQGDVDCITCITTSRNFIVRDNFFKG